MGGGGCQPASTTRMIEDNGGARPVRVFPFAEVPTSRIDRASRSPHFPPRTGIVPILLVRRPSENRVYLGRCHALLNTRRTSFQRMRLVVPCRKREQAQRQEREGKQSQGQPVPRLSDLAALSHRAVECRLEFRELHRLLLFHGLLLEH